MRNRKIALLFLLLVFNSSLMTFQSIRGPINILTVLRIPLYQFEWVSKNAWDRIKSPFILYSRLKDENYRLRTELDKFRFREQEFEEAMLENQRLNALLTLGKASYNFVTYARVISSGIRQWPGVVVIDKGELEGIQKDMAVRTPYGLVGKVIEAMPSFSRVLLITDVNSSVSVRFQDSRIEGVLSGRGNGLCTLKYILRDRDMNGGELLITSGLDGIFPKGIPVGYITMIQRGDDLFQDIEIQPIINTSMLEEVMVFKR